MRAGIKTARSSPAQQNEYGQQVHNPSPKLPRAGRLLRIRLYQESLGLGWALARQLWYIANRELRPCHSWMRPRSTPRKHSYLWVDLTAILVIPKLHINRRRIPRRPVILETTRLLQRRRWMKLRDSLLISWDLPVIRMRTCCRPFGPIY